MALYFKCIIQIYKTISLYCGAFRHKENNIPAFTRAAMLVNSKSYINRAFRISHDYKADFLTVLISDRTTSFHSRWLLI
jgi:hypothetical protein